MKNGLDIDNPFFEFMGALADIVMVNILFLLFSLPIITIGASMSSMYRTFQEMREGTLTSAYRYFIRYFRASLKKSFRPWMSVLITGAVLFFNLGFVAGAKNSVYWHIVGMVTGCMLLLWMLIFCYLFPAGIYQKKGTLAAVSESLYLAVWNLPYTLVMALLNSLPFLCIILGSYFIMLATPVYLTAGFGITAYLNMLLLEKCKGIGGTDHVSG